jgi:hypothetical protein
MGSSVKISNHKLLCWAYSEWKWYTSVPDQTLLGRTSAPVMVLVKLWLYIKAPDLLIERILKRPLSQVRKDNLILCGDWGIGSWKKKVPWHPLVPLARAFCGTRLQTRLDFMRVSLRNNEEPIWLDNLTRLELVTLSGCLSRLWLLLSTWNVFQVRPFVGCTSSHPQH